MDLLRSNPHQHYFGIPWSTMDFPFIAYLKVMYPFSIHLSIHSLSIDSPFISHHYPLIAHHRPSHIQYHIGYLTLWKMSNPWMIYPLNIGFSKMFHGFFPSQCRIHQHVPRFHRHTGPHRATPVPRAPLVPLALPARLARLVLRVEPPPPGQPAVPASARHRSTNTLIFTYTDLKPYRSLIKCIIQQCITQDRSLLSVFGYIYIYIYIFILF